MEDKKIKDGENTGAETLEEMSKGIEEVVTEGESPEPEEAEEAITVDSPEGSPEEEAVKSLGEIVTGRKDESLGGSINTITGEVNPPEAETPSEETKPKKKKSKKGLVIALVVILVILIALGCFAFYVYGIVKKVISSTKDTQKSIVGADSAALSALLPEDLAAKEAEKYSFEETDVTEAVDFLITSFNTKSVTDSEKFEIEKVKSFEKIKSEDAKQETEDAINEFFAQQFKGQEDRFAEVFPNAFAYAESAKNIYRIEYKITDGTADDEVDTLILNIDGKYYDIDAIIAADMSCYYYSSYLEYMMSAGQDADENYEAAPAETETETENETESN